MAKKYYDYNVFVGKAEELKRIRRVERRRKRVKRIFWLCVLAVVAIVLMILYNSRCEYYKYTNVIEDEDNAGVSYDTFADGYLKYSVSGIEYQKRYGYAEWNEAVSYQNPYLVTSKNYALYGDRGGNSISLFGTNGLVRKQTLKYPLMQATVSNQGNVQVILEGEGSNYIQVYDVNGNLVADIRSSIEDTGYPIAAAISPDGVTLAVSYYSITGVDTKTSVVFYDFSSQVQNNSLDFFGAFEYEGTLIPRVFFMDDKTVVAVGDDAVHYYDVSSTPKEKKTIADEEHIKSIFYNKKYLGLVYDHSEKQTADEGMWRVCLFNKNGGKKMDVNVDMDYNTIKLWDDQIVAYSGNTCTFMNLRGKILFQEPLEGDLIEDVLPVFGWRTYRVIFSDREVKMRLKFLQ